VSIKNEQELIKKEIFSKEVFQRKVKSQIRPQDKVEIRLHNNSNFRRIKIKIKSQT